MTDSGTKCAWLINESITVQIHVHNNRRCLYVPRVPGSVNNPYNKNVLEPIHVPRPYRQKPYLQTCAPSEDSDQLGAFRIAKDAKFLHADNEYYDQNARVHRLI